MLSTSATWLFRRLYHHKQSKVTCIMFHSSNSSKISSRSILHAARSVTNAETMLQQSNLNRIMANTYVHGNMACFAQLHVRKHQHQRHPFQAYRLTCTLPVNFRGIPPLVDRIQVPGVHCFHVCGPCMLPVPRGQAVLMSRQIWSCVNAPKRYAPALHGDSISMSTGFAMLDVKTCRSPARLAAPNIAAKSAW